MKQIALTLALALPLVVTVMLTGPFAASTSAQAGQRMVGPRSPILLDTNGDGRPTPGADAPTGTQVQGTTQLQVSTPVSCGGGSSSMITFGGSTAGQFTTAGRRTGSGRDQSIAISTAGGVASQLRYTESDTRGTRAQADLSLVDVNRDGRYDTLSVSGTVNTTVSLVFTPDSSYVSIPVAQAALLGARGRTCAAVPQIWVPLADTNGDGRGDAVIFDLDGNGLPDPQLARGPDLGAPGVPTMNNVALLILTMLLGSIGVWYLGQHRLGGANPA